MIPLLEERRSEIAALCRRYGVRRLDLFGSAATGEFDPESSDLDFLATLTDTDAPGYVSRYLALADGLEAIFRRPVDVVIDGSIRNPRYRREVDAARQPVYEDQDAPAVA